MRVMTPAKFRAIVWKYYRAHGRHELPWRKTKDTYKILVSEVMLQQTQVERVIPFYTKFIKQFPTAKKLAAAPLSQVLKAWQGLGYNRRAKMLHSAAKKLTLATELEKLSGVGPYTARAVAAFAYNEDVIFVETNIRTAIIHHFFPRREKIGDSEIEEVLRKVYPVKGKNSKSSGPRPGTFNGAREWYSALMDYGAHLKRSGISHNAKSKTYAKQSKFAGSLREARGVILREYTKGITSRARLTNLFGPSRKKQMKTALEALIAEGLINESLV